MKWTALVLCLLALPCSATVHHVYPGGAIQDGINAASPRDTVMVHCGKYNETGIVVKPGIQLVSETGDSSCVIIDLLHGTPQTGTIMFFDGCGDTTSLRGFTLMNGAAVFPPFNGGAIVMTDSSPILESVRIMMNSAIDFGGGIYCDNASPYVYGSSFVGNVGTGGGGGIACFNNSHPVIDSCWFIANAGSVGGAILCDNSSPSVSYSFLFSAGSCNQGAGLWCSESSPTLNNVTFAGCQAGVGTSGQCVHLAFQSSPHFDNCCFMNSGFVTGPLNFAEDGMSLPIFACCNTYAWNGATGYGGTLADPTGTDGNIAEDPLFCDWVSFDASVDAASPNLPGHPSNTCGVLIGARGQGCDSPVEARSWGTIKAIYR